MSQPARIHLRGGPRNGISASGRGRLDTEEVPPRLDLTDHYTVVASGAVIPTMFELSVGFYLPSGEECPDGHRYFIWVPPDDRWN